MKIRKFVAATAVACIAPLANADIGIATATPAGTNYPVGEDIRNFCAHLPIRNVQSTGSLDNIDKLLTDRNVQFGIVQQDALNFRKITQPEAMKKIVMVFPFFSSYMHLVATEQSGIKSLADLAGKRVHIGPQGSGTWTTSQMTKALTGIEWQDFEERPADGIKALLDGERDAMFFVAGMPIKTYIDLGAEVKNKIRLVDVRHPDLSDFYEEITVPARTYPWHDGEVKTYGVRNVLATYNYATTSAQKVISDVATCIVQKLPELKKEGHPAWQEIDPTALNLVKWPVHPAARRAVNAAK